MISSRILECHYEANTPSRCNLTRLSRLHEGRVCFCLYFWDGLAHTPMNTHGGTELLRPTNPSGVSRLLDSVCCSVWGLSLPRTQPRCMLSAGCQQVSAVLCSLTGTLVSSVATWPVTDTETSQTLQSFGVEHLFW